MTKQEIFEMLREAWDSYGEIANPSKTTYQLREVDEFLDDIRRLITDN